MFGMSFHSIKRFERQAKAIFLVSIHIIFDTYITIFQIQLISFAKLTQGTKHLELGRLSEND